MVCGHLGQFRMKIKLPRTAWPATHAMGRMCRNTAKGPWLNLRKPDQLGPPTLSDIERPPTVSFQVYFWKLNEICSMTTEAPVASGSL